MTRALAALLIVVFAALSGLHVFWAAGGRAGGDAAVPRVEGRVLFSPSPLSTLGVAAALAAAALVVAAASGWLGPRAPVRSARWLTAAIALLFFARAVGDFRYVGLFKTVGEDPFRTWDTWLFSPLCLGIAVAAALVAIRRP